MDQQTGSSLLQAYLLFKLWLPSTAIFLLILDEKKKKGLATNGIWTRVFYSLTSLCCFISEAAATTLTKNPSESFPIHFLAQTRETSGGSKIRLIFQAGFDSLIFMEQPKKLLKESVDRITSFLFYSSLNTTRRKLRFRISPQFLIKATLENVFGHKLSNS